MSKHSKGPWVTVNNGGINQLIESADGDVIVYTIGNAGMRDAEKAGNARRIVAAINICAGISTEELERHHDLVGAQLASEHSRACSAALVGELYQVLGALGAPERVLDQVSAAENGEALPHKTLLPFVSDGHEALVSAASQRDELLSALEALVAKAECFGMGNSTDEYAAAQAVIKKAGGGQPSALPDEPCIYPNGKTCPGDGAGKACANCPLHAMARITRGDV